MLGFFIVLASAFAVYAYITMENYKQLRTNEVAGIVAYESQRVSSIITEMERNAVDLALSGRQLYLSGEHSASLGISVIEENFRAFSTAVGGGIWFEPYALEADRHRACFYAFFDLSTGNVHYDPDFETEHYDYHAQQWYKTIIGELKAQSAVTGTGKYSVVWTAPYSDTAGTNALMTTVGAGIYDEYGHLIGISTVDWEIQSMIDRLIDIRPTESSFVLLASNKDDYIISYTRLPSQTRTGLSLSAILWYSNLHSIGTDGVSIEGFTEDGTEYITFSNVLDNGWLFSISIPVNEIFQEVERLNTGFITVISCSFIILLLTAAFLISRFINRPLRKLTSGVEELGAGNLDKKIEIESKDELGVLASAFNKMTGELKNSIDQIAQERAEKERIGTELDIAAKIQASMLPSIFPPFPDRKEFELFASMQPAKEVGGDFYDFFLIDENTLAVVIADVSGKGVPAALFMVIAKTLIKNSAQNASCGGDASCAIKDKSPKEVFEEVNNILCENNDTGMFVTVFMGYLDIPSGKLTYVNAGHNPPFIRHGGCFKRIMVKPGFVLAGIEGMAYTQDELIMQPGDALFLYTDGVTEAVNNSIQLFGELRFLDVINRCISLPPAELCASVRYEIDKFSGGTEQVDDITMLILHYNGVERKPNELTIEAKTENLNAVLGFVNAQLETAGCSAKLQTQITMCIEEIFINIAKYAYTPETGQVTICIDTGKDIRIEFEDYGTPYNPLEKEDPDVFLSAEEREIGGLGFFMVKKTMDSVEYRRDRERNVLTIRKAWKT